jgi:molybdopterin molybdotransferase
LRARIETDATGASVIQLHGRKGAGVISSLTGAEGLVELPLEAEKIIAGQMLSFMPFQEIGI